MNKQVALHWAETIDSLRVFPRAFLVACFLWVVQITYALLNWYVHLPKEERGPEATGFACIVFVSALGFLKMVFTEYSKNGRDWNSQPPSVTSSVVASTVTTGAPTS